MGSNSINKVSQIIEIEDDIIDLDEEDKTPEDVIYEWDAQIRRKLSKSSVADNEYVLRDLMKKYLESLQEMIRNYEDNETLKNKVLGHISFLYLYYWELQCCSPDNYLTQMEEILTIFCNLVLEVVRPLKPKNFSSENKYKKRVISVARQIIYVLTLYLLERQDHILHVLIKMNTNKTSDMCSEVLNILYRHFLINVPAFNLCDESFCRNYIVFQKWKEIRKPQEWEEMDKVMYKKFKRTPESVKNSETLKKILMPSCTSTVDIVLNLFKSFRAISGAYFKHVGAKKNVEIDDLNFNIDLGEDDPIVPVNDEDEEEVQFLKTFYEVERNMSNLSQMTSEGDIADLAILRKCKEELDEDDDVQFVSTTILPKSPIREILINKEDDFAAVTNTCNNIPKEAPLLTVPSPSLILTTTQEKTSEIEKVDDALTRIRVGSPRTVPIPSDSCHPEPEPEPTVEPAQPPLIETNQPKVPFANNPPETNPPSPARTTEQVQVSDVTPSIEVKSVEVQANNSNKDYLYNDYGLTTPPFEVQTDEQTSRPVEKHLYANFGESLDKSNEKNVTTRTVEVQVDGFSKDCAYDDCGLTPPNDTHSEDHGQRLEEPVYIGQKEDFSLQHTHNDDVAQENGEIETEKEDEINHPNEELDELLDDQLDISDDLANIEEDDEEIDVESCPIERPNLELLVNSEESTISDQIDTGQKPILNSALNIHSPITAESEIKDHSNVLKPLVPLDRTNGQSKESSSKIVFTSPQKVRTTSLDVFSRFESAINQSIDGRALNLKENQELDDYFSAPISKTITKENLLNSSDKLDLFNSESIPKPSSPDVTSPPYENFDDFRNYFSNSVNKIVPQAPPGILKKGNAKRKNDHKISFHNSTHGGSEERKRRSDGILVPKNVRKDPKLNMNAEVVIKRLTFLDNKVKTAVNQSTIRVDYDKTTRHLNKNDVVRWVSPTAPLKLSWIVDPSSKDNQGKVKTSYKKPSKCENFSCCNQLAEEFRLNCNVCESALNLTIPPVDPEPEFSNSPKFLQDTDELVQHCLQETDTPPGEVKIQPLLCDNSNFYKINSELIEKCNSEIKSISDFIKTNSDLNRFTLDSNKISESSISTNLESFNSIIDDNLLTLPTAVPESYDFEKNLKNEVFSKIDWQNFEDSDGETRLPLKKRKLSVANNEEEVKKEEISYPATPMISIAEVEALHPIKLQTNPSRPFKTPAERKEMPPLPVFYNVDNDTSPIITDQFNINNHTYNNPTINYHMNNVPVPFINIPCGSYYSLPPILLPFNNVSTFEQSKVNQVQEAYVKKETKKRRRRQ